MTNESELHLVEDAYTEKEARLHVIRVRELIGAAGDRTDTLHGIMSGLSLHDSLVAVDSTQDEQATAMAHPMSGYDFQTNGTLSTRSEERV